MYPRQIIIPVSAAWLLLITPSALAVDSDGDGLLDLAEVARDLDPFDDDSDGDTLPDGAELLALGTDPHRQESRCVPWVRNSIDDNAWGAAFVAAADLDGDGDLDVVAGLALLDAVVWYENTGGGRMGPAHLLSTDSVSVRNVQPADLDGDGDIDLIASSKKGNTIEWFENLGGFFAPKVVLEKYAPGAISTAIADLDGDGDLDIVGALGVNDSVIWIQNLRGGQFADSEVIAIDTYNYPYSVATGDVDQDGDPDIVVAADNTVAWIENLGGGNFGAGHTIAVDSNALRSVRVADIDGDGLSDILTGAASTDRISWFQNLGGGNFSPTRIIGMQNGVRAVHTADVDGDGRVDVLAASRLDNEIGLYRNLGNGIFEYEEIISDNAVDAYWVTTGDMDGDGDLDILSAAFFGGQLSWYPNRGVDDDDGDGLSESAETCALGTDPLLADTDGGGVDDRTELLEGNDPTVSGDDGVFNVALPPPLSADTDGDGIPNGLEWQIGTNPYRVDSDFDGLSDFDEVGDPNNPVNTDGDSLIDALDGDDDQDGIETGVEAGGFDTLGAPDSLNDRSHELLLAVVNIVSKVHIRLDVRAAIPGETVHFLQGQQGISGPEALIGGATLGLTGVTEIGTAVVDTNGEASLDVFFPVAQQGTRFYFQVVDPDGVNSMRSRVAGNNFDTSN